LRRVDPLSSAARWSYIERADTAAKSVLSLPITNMKLPAGELFLRSPKLCLNEYAGDMGLF